MQVSNRLKAILIIFFLSFALISSAQICTKGIPATQKKTYQKSVQSDIPTYTLPKFDVQKLIDEDIENETKAIPWRFGKKLNTDINYFKRAQKERLNAKLVVYRLRIYSKSALSLNFFFNNFYIPKGDELYIYSEATNETIGAITDNNNHESGVLATSLVFDEAVIIEYNQTNFKDVPKLHIDYITHGYRNALDYAKSFGGSGSCNNNVACPEAQDFEDQIRATCMLLVNGSAFCSGTLLNNTKEDGTPYVLTANHCIRDQYDNWVFWFNWQSATCENPTSSPANQSISGCAFRAKNPYPEFCLVELNQTPPADYNVYYAGWDRNDNPVDNQTCIHHPKGDIKKISFDYNPAQKVEWSNSICWEVVWDDGTTEVGSSGSGLYNQDKRLIGQLFGGYASCTNMEASDYYGRFAVSWDYGTTPETRLKDWLDPIDAGIDFIDGYDPAAQYTFDAKLMYVNVPSNPVCSSGSLVPMISVKNNGITPINSLNIKYRLNQSEYQNLQLNETIYTGEVSTISLDEITVSEGENTIDIEIISVNNLQDENSENNVLNYSFTVLDNNKEVSVEILNDFNGDESSWELKEYYSQEVLMAGGPYASTTEPIVNNYKTCLPKGCYKFTMYDDAGNGMCCSSGEGYYGIINTSIGDTITLGGEFAYDTSIVFCIDTILSVPKKINQERNVVYPNPCAGILYFSSKENIVKILAYDVSGKEYIIGNNIYKKSLQFDITDLVPGIYIFEIQSKEGIYRKKVIIE